jgi:hypothetical protein
MKKLTLKWKVFLIANYFLLSLTILSILSGIISMVNSRDGIKAPEAVILFLILFLLTSLICILNIFVVNRYFPDSSLSLKTRQLLKVARVTMIVVTALTGLIFIALFTILFDHTERKDWWAILGIIFFGTVFFLCLYITILQFQISRYLNKTSSGAINQLIDSIGT